MGTPLFFGMSWFPKRTVLGLAVLLTLPTAASAFSLGNIQVRTQFGELFQAEIPLLLYLDEEAKGAEASVASADAYQRLKLPRDLAVTQLTVQMRGKGANRQIILQSDTPLRTPFFNLLLKTSVGVGSHYRNYPVFLKMPQADHGAVPTIRHAALPSRVAPPPLSQTTQSNGASLQQTYGPVRVGESVYGIAKKIQPAGASLFQTIVALWTANKNKPGFDNINTLPVGIMLDRPTQEAITRLSAGEVAQVLEQQRLIKQDKTTVTVKPKPSVPNDADKGASQSIPKIEAAAKPTPPLATTEEQATKTVPSSVLPPSIEPVSVAPPPPPPTTEAQVTKADPPSVARDLVNENQQLILRVNKAEEQLELFSKKLLELAAHALQTETDLATVQVQLAAIQPRLQQLEQKSVVSASVAPIPAAPLLSPAQEPPPQPKTVSKELPFDESWLLYGGSGLAGLLVILLAWLKRKKKAQPLDIPVTAMVQQVKPLPQDEIPSQEEEKPISLLVEPTLLERPPAISVAAVVVPTFVPSEPLFLEKPAIPADHSEHTDSLSSVSPFQEEEGESGLVVASLEKTATPSDYSEHVDLLSSVSPFQEEEGESGLVAPLASLERMAAESISHAVKLHPPLEAPVVVLANKHVDEIIVDDDEESIFKDLLESAPQTERAIDKPTVYAALAMDAVSKEGEEPLEMFEFKPISADPVIQKKGDESPPKPTKPATDSGEDVLLEWVVDEQ